MFKLRFTYNNGAFEDFDHVVRAEYSEVHVPTVVLEEEMLTHKFPIGRDIYMYSENRSYVASGKDLRAISVVKE